MTFQDIRIEKGYRKDWVQEKLKEEYDIELSDWQFNDRENHPKKYLPNEIKALCKIYEVDIDDVEF